MTFNQEWTYPQDHPISPERAKELMQGEAGQYNYEILASACSPIYWHFPDEKGAGPICANGTLSYVQGEGRVFGVTAAHVIRAYQRDAEQPGCLLQLGNAELAADIIDICDKRDLATLALPDKVLAEVGKQVMPISLCRAGDVPQEGRGIMFCGYVGEDRREQSGRVDWGMLGVVGIARRVYDDQITWAPDHEHHVPVGNVPAMPRNKELGGISGGPLIAWFEKPLGGFSYFSLAGIVKEANAQIENVVATRSHFIQSDGRILK